MHVPDYFATHCFTYPEALSLYYPQQDNHNSNHQQNVDETTHGGGCDQTQQPQDEHNYSNGIKHDFNLSLKRPLLLDYRCRIVTQ
jgi:hypothetical protein